MKGFFSGQNTQIACLVFGVPARNYYTAAAAAAAVLEPSAVLALDGATERASEWERDTTESKYTHTHAHTHTHRHILILTLSHTHSHANMLPNTLPRRAGRTDG